MRGRPTVLRLALRLALGVDGELVIALLVGEPGDHLLEIESIVVEKAVELQGAVEMSPGLEGITGAQQEPRQTQGSRSLEDWLSSSEARSTTS